MKPTPTPHGHTGAPPRATPIRSHLAGNTSGTNSPSHTISLPSVPHHLIGRFGCHRGFSTKNHVGLIWYNMSYDVDTLWRLRQWSLFPKNLTWDRSGQGHLRRVNILIPSTNHSMITMQTESSIPDNYRGIPTLHSPVDEYLHPPSLNRPNDDSLTKNPLPIACLFPPQGHQVNNTKAWTMSLVTAWVQIEESNI